MSLSQCCVKGSVHKGTPQGKIEKIDGIPVYIGQPTGDYDKTKALLYLPDVFGIELDNNKLNVDAFAAEGIATYAPDLFNGDPVPVEEMEAGKFDLGKWFPHHGPDVARPPIDKLIAHLKSKGVTSFAATGMCYGGRYVADLILDDTISVGIFNHPSLLKVPDDLEALRKKNAYTLWNVCENDSQLGPKEQKVLDEVFEGDSKFKKNYYAKATHGFAVRGDLSIPEVKHAQQDSFEESVKLFKAHV